MSDSRPPRRSVKIRIRWNILVPIAVIAAAALGVLWLDLASSGEAEPPPLLGAIGTPIRGTFVPPTPTPTGTRPTPQPRPSVGPQVPGTPAERDAKRREDMLHIFAALQQYHDAHGDYPATSDHIQTLCVYEKLDAGCGLKEYLDPVPRDPLASVQDAGYWYQSDGTKAKVYVSFEEDVTDERCVTDYVDFKDFANLVCPQIPS